MNYNMEDATFEDLLERANRELFMKTIYTNY